MPIYEYACDECKCELEFEQKMSDEPLTVCPRCSGRLRRVFNASSIIFKGSGFYVNDSRPQEESKPSS
ncbi:MAG: FmdB family zinc ribbon protein [Sphaerochaetaceae bacterium]